MTQNPVVDAYSAKAWRQYVGETAKPTIVLFVISFAMLIGASMLALSGKLPYFLATIINTVAIYLLFTPAHEAVHGNIKGKNRKLSWLENSIGWISSMSFTAPLPMFSYLHLEHHAHTNDPKNDPDYWVAGQNIFVVLFKCSLIIFDYHFFYWKDTSKHLKENPFQFFVSLLALLLIYGGAVYWIVSSGWEAPVLLWILPAWLATTFLAYVFDYLPHHPHAVQKRYLDTRIILYPGLTTLLLSQNMHLIHHLYPNIPYYHYGKAFKAIRKKLEEKGAPIEDYESKSN